VVPRGRLLLPDGGTFNGWAGGGDAPPFGRRGALPATSNFYVTKTAFVE